MQSGENRMFSHAPKPITGIRGIGFSPVYDGMPVASFPRRIILRDLVAQLPMAGHQDKTAQRGLRVARVREQLFGIGGHESLRQILRLEVAGGKRDRPACACFEDRENKRVEIGGVPGHDFIFAR